ncbi:DUF7344 domain-containing protein [Haladaptatus salinisoli]|uniref:DUF7344 domain-containing protein n=1 Tax=Haladaptatus salinisoli TaxID=2884876 RepID=UPI003F5EDE16
MINDSPHSSNPSFDTLFKILANQHRRYLLYHLSTMNEETLTLSALVNRLAQDVAITHKRLRINLHQRHLPKLADHNVIEYDSRSQTIRYRGSDRLEILLEMCRHQERE